MICTLHLANFPAQAFAAPPLRVALSVDGFTLISSTRVARTTFRFTYSAVLTNRSKTNLPGVTALATSSNPNLKVVNQTLTFGAVPAGAGTKSQLPIPSQDTFTIEQDRSQPFNPQSLHWTFNLHPQADAGDDRTAQVNQTVQLDGSRSSDLDGDELTFHWTLVREPTNSGASLLNATTVQPSLRIDLPGTYEIQLIVNDGSVDSAPDTVKISTTNSAPTANAGPDQTVKLNSLVTLDGSGSKDLDGDPLTYQWTLVTVPQGSIASLQNPTTVNPTFTADKPGAYHVRLVVNDGKVQSTEDIVIVSTENSAPVANAGPDLTGVVNQLIQLDGSASKDVDGNPLSYLWSFVSVPDTSNAVLSDPTIVNPTFTPDVAGMYVVQLVVNDGKLNSEPDSAKVTVTVTGGGGTPGTTEACYTGPDDTQGVGICQAGTQTCDSNGTFGACVGEVLPATEVPGNAIDENCDGLTPECSAGATQSCYSGLAGTASVGICKAGTQTCGTNGTFGACAGQVLPTTEIANNGIDEDCNGVDETTGPPLPPDPATVAPPLNASVATSIADATVFLYTGSNPIQTGVDSVTIDARRVAVLRGNVLDKSNAPLSGVTITILNHPEFGQTLSRADGMFDLVVNGGGLLTVNYAKPGFIAAQRQVQTPWRDYVWLPDVVLIPYDSRSTFIDLSAATFQVAQGSVITDARGTRQATLLFKPGTQATMRLPDGGTQPLTTLHVRATEQSVGENGPESTTAEEPPTAAYTYGVDFSADEAVAAHALSLAFNQPVIMYVQNFIGFPVGGGVPVGGYDANQGLWMPHPNGRVVKVLSVTNGQATLDVKGAGQAASSAELAELGITEQELQEVGRLYLPGQTLWRAEIPHFSYWDTWWPFGLPLVQRGPI